MTGIYYVNLETDHSVIASTFRRIIEVNQAFVQINRILHDIKNARSYVMHSKIFEKDSGFYVFNK